MAMRTITTREELMETVYGFRSSRIILTAFELGLFSGLGKASLDAAQLAKRIDAEPRACERLLNALCILALVKKTRGRFRNAKIARTYLVAGQPGFLAGLTHSANQWRSWNTLSEAVRRGTSVLDRKTGGQADERLRGFIAAMHERASLQAPRFVQLLDLSAVDRCLDIGAGAVFALNMLVATARGDSYTGAEIAGWMKAAGLKKIRKINTPFDAELLVGWKM